MTRQYLDLGSASDWSYRVENFLQPIKSTTQIWGSDTSSVWNFCARFSDVIRWETSGGVPKYRLISQARWAQVDKYQFYKKFTE